MNQDHPTVAEPPGPLTQGDEPELYLACLLYKTLRNGLDAPDNLWEESFVVLKAEDEQAAEQAAEQLGVENETSYRAISGDWVDWKFFRVDFVAPLAWPPESGAEICSRFFTREERPGVGQDEKPTVHLPTT